MLWPIVIWLVCVVLSAWVLPWLCGNDIQLHLIWWKTFCLIILAPNAFFHSIFQSFDISHLIFLHIFHKVRSWYADAGNCDCEHGNAFDTFLCYFSCFSSLTNAYQFFKSASFTDGISTTGLKWAKVKKVNVLIPTSSGTAQDHYVTVNWSPIHFMDKTWKFG